MKKIVKTGVLSFGMSGSLFHCPFLKEHDGFELVGVTERTTKKVHLIYPQVKSYHTVNDIISDSQIELIIVNTPSSTHFEFALQAIRAGKHVLVEKPFTPTLAEAKVLYTEAKKYGCLVLPYQNRRYDSDFLSVKKVVESGKLGDLIEVHFRYDRYNDEISENISKESDLPGNGVLYNLGSHVIDGAIDLFGIPNKWSSCKQKRRPNTKVDDYASVQLEYNNDLQVFITVSLLVADAQPSFVLHGTKGSYVKKRCDIQEEQLKLGLSITEESYGVELPNNEGSLTVIEKGEVFKEKIISKKASYLNIFEDVYQAISNNKLYPITEEQILKQIEILED